MTTHGILLLDKPSGLTSNAALTRAKHILKIKKAGHTGALDPMATGLLPLCFGQATKVSQFLLESDKQYLADIRLGITTNSGDADGEITDKREVPKLSREQIETVLEPFRGPIEQIPPMVSALKYKGKRLHELARAGIEVERKPRSVTIHQLDLLDIDTKRLTVRVACSKGTYIRSLAMDIGDVIGCGAHLSALRRERSGPFSLEQSVSLDALSDMSPDEARDQLIPPDHALSDLPSIELTPEQTVSLRHGQSMKVNEDQTELVRMYSDEVFIGIGSINELGVMRSRRLFSI